MIIISLVFKDMEKYNKNLRAAMLKKRYANVILKCQQQVLGKAFDGEKMKNTKMREKQLHEQKPNRSWKEIEKQLGSPPKASKG